MVLRIARNKATDLLRQRGHRINLDEDAILEAVVGDTKGSDLILQWRLHVFPAEARELREILLAFIAMLPERQRIVAQCFIDNYEDFRARDTYRPLAEAVSAITHVTESVAAVKSEWRYAREKIIAELKARLHLHHRGVRTYDRREQERTGRAGTGRSARLDPSSS